MKFKVGQKVRVKQWLNMLPRIKDIYMFTPASLVGKIAIISSFDTNETKRLNIQAYLVDFIDECGMPDGYLFFEPELESLVKVGEQLLLFELD